MPPIDDLTHEAPERVAAICRALVGLGAVLHGSNVKPMLGVLEPRQANDAAKRSGNQCAVYASTNVDAVLMHAVLDRRRLARRFESYTVGYRHVAGRSTFRATANVLALVHQRDRALFSEGCVYVLDAAPFVRSADCADEFTALQPQVPLRTLKIDSCVGWHLVRESCVEGYGMDDLARITAHRLALPRVSAPRLTARVGDR